MMEQAPLRNFKIMNYENLNADINLILPRNFTRGREGRSVNKIIVHWNGGDLSLQSCYNALYNNGTSAHYQVDKNGRIAQYVWDDNTAWHAGNWDANLTSIGIEHANQSNSMTAETLKAGGRLAGALCKAFDLGVPTWRINVFPHSDFSATQCCGSLRDNTDYLNAYMNYAVKQYYGWSDEPTQTPYVKIKKVENAVYRLCNPQIASTHFFTCDHNEAEICANSGWLYEGVAWLAPQSGDIPVYRLYNVELSEHLYTPYPTEALETTNDGWQYESIAFYSGSGEGVHRLYNHKLRQHFYTADFNEFENCLKNGWVDEGRTFNAM